MPTPPLVVFHFLLILASLTLLLTPQAIINSLPHYRTAGSDTTANSTAAILFHILRSPRVLHRLRAEVEAAVSEHGDEDEDGLVRYDQVRMPFVYSQFVLSFTHTSLLPDQISQVPPSDYGRGFASLRNQRLWAPTCRPRRNKRVSRGKGV